MSVFPGFPAFLARHRLLLCLVMLSLLLHAGTIAMVDLRLAWPDRSEVKMPLDVRFAQTGGAISIPRPPLRPSVPESIDPFAPLPAARFDPAPLAAPPPAPSEQPAQEPVILGFAELPVEAPPAETVEDTIRMAGESPGLYQSSPPYSARVDYRVTRGDGGTPARDDGSARLVWETNGSTYRMALNGVLGELSSEGGLDDLGIAPQRALEPLGPGRATTLFDRREELIMSAIGAWRAPLMPGSQDTASALMQLAGMGRSMETQLLGVVKLWVGGAAGARLEHYRMIGRETIDSGMGALETVRVARLNPPGMEEAPQLEIWFAPGHGWLPVQLRVTASDGQVRTQTVTAIDTDAPSAR